MMIFYDETPERAAHVQDDGTDLIVTLEVWDEERASAVASDNFETSMQAMMDPAYKTVRREIGERYRRADAIKIAKDWINHVES